MSSNRTAKSKLFHLNSISPKEDLEEKLEKCHGVLVKLTTNLSDREIHDVLNQTVSKGPKDHEEISLGLFYTILIEPLHCEKAFMDLSLISRDSFALVLGKLTAIITDKWQRLFEIVRKQIIWFVDKLVTNSVSGVENVCCLLIKQIQGGDLSPSNIWLAENVLLLLKGHRDWLVNNSMVLTIAVYSYLRLIEDHESQALRGLRQQETEFCVSLLRSNFTDCIQIGRDLIRVLQNCTRMLHTMIQHHSVNDRHHEKADSTHIYFLLPVHRITEFTALWKDLLHKPQALSEDFTGIAQILAIRTSRRYLASRVTVDMENKLAFLTSKVRFGLQKRYQDWFYRLYLHSPECHTLIPDLVRYLCGVIHPSNEVLCSDIIPRWAILGWLATVCQTPVTQTNTRLACFFDWLFFSPEKDSIMNIEPGMLLMHNSVKTHPTITYGLLDFVVRMIPNYCKQLESVVSLGVKNSFRNLLEKRVVSTILPLFHVVRTDRELKSLLKTYFSDFLGNETAGDASTEEPTSPKSEISDPIISSGNRKDFDMSDNGSHIELPDHDTDEAVFSDEDEDTNDNTIKKNKNDNKIISVIDADDVNTDKHKWQPTKDVSEMEEFQLIGNSLLRDNLCKLKTEKNNSSRLEAMDSILSTVEAIDLQDEMLTSLYACLANCLADDLFLPLLSNETRNTDSILDQPQFSLFRLISSFIADSGGADCYLALFIGLHEIKNSIGYHYLYYLKTSNNEIFSPYEDAVTFTKERTLKDALMQDLQSCRLYDPELFLHIIVSVFKAFPKICVGNSSLIRELVSCIAPAELHSIISNIIIGDIVIIGENQVESLLIESLTWDSFEQYCFWQILIAEETPVEMVIGILPILDSVTHSEALCNLLLQLRHESPIADIVKPVLCMDIENSKAGSYFSACLFKYWCQESSRDLSIVIAQLLTKQASVTTKRRQARNAALRHQPTMSQILHHLNNFHTSCPKASEKGVFKHEGLKLALEQARANLTDSKLRIRFEELFAVCREAERPTRKRKTRDSNRNAQISSESDESEDEEVENEDDNSEKSDDNETDSSVGGDSRMLRSRSSPSKKRRRSSLNESEED